MKTLQEKAIPILVRLAAGEWWELSAAEKMSLAAWATMFTMTWEYADTNTISTPQHERTYLMETGTPPAHWWIGIAEFGGVEWEYRAAHHGGYLKPPPYDQNASPRLNFQVTTFTFGKLLLQTYSNRSDFHINIADYFRRLGLQATYPLNFSVIRKPARPRRTMKSISSQTPSYGVCHPRFSAPACWLQSPAAILAFSRT